MLTILRFTAQVKRYSLTNSRRIRIWAHEYKKGLVDGRKDRPCAVILAMQGQGDDLEVTVAPITHTIPEDPLQSVELTDATRRRLGLDGERSWVITSEVNTFKWPGPDLRLTPTGRYEYGFLPATVFEAVKEKILNPSPVQVLRTE